MSAKSLIAVVTRDGYQLLIGSDGCEALDLSRRYQGHIDLLISDIQMPGMTGIELASMLAKERPDTKVLLISGSPGEEVPSTVSFLSKPFFPEKLRQAILKLVQPEAQELAG